MDLERKLLRTETAKMNIFEREGWYENRLQELEKELKSTQESLLKVQNIAKDQMRKLPTRINEARMAGHRAAGSAYEEAVNLLKREREARFNDNADLTEQIIQAETRAEELEVLLRALLFNADVLTVNILRNWDRAKIVRFAQRLLGQDCQRCEIPWEGADV